MKLPLRLTLSYVIVWLAVGLFFCGIAVTLRNPEGAKAQSATQSPAQAEVARVRGTIADLYKQGKYDEAIPLASQVLEIERRLGSERAEFAVALTTLAELYFAKRKDSAAEPLFEQAAAIYERHQNNAPALSVVLERIAQIRFLKRKYEEAVMFLQRSLFIREQTYGAESSQVAETSHALANVYQVDRQPHKADPLYLRSIMIKEKILGRTNPDTVRAMKDYACLRVRNHMSRLKKEEIKSDLTPEEIERNSVVERASCWLNGFRQDCDTLSYDPLRRLSAILNGKAVKLVQPPYPQWARLDNIRGSVFVAILIDEEGKVIKATPVCGGHPKLNGGAVEAARASKFTPTKIDNRPIKVQGLIVYNFR